MVLYRVIQEEGYISKGFIWVYTGWFRRKGISLNDLYDFIQAAPRMMLPAGRPATSWVVHYTTSCNTRTSHNTIRSVPTHSPWWQVAVTVWLVPDVVDTVVRAPDDGWRYHPKHVEQFTDTNKLCIVASCWTVTDYVKISLVFFERI